ncbi:MAG: hypothetical protein AAFP69_11850, partial [Planctomycetota bacterium]
MNDLHAVYAAAEYHVGSFLLRVDAPHAKWDQWLRDNGHYCFAIVTAHNPGSQPCEPAQNHRAQLSLQSIVR